MFGQPCDNLATTLSQPCDSFIFQGCAKVVTRLHCGNLVTMFGQPCHNLATMFGQPCHNLATVSKYKVVPRLCQGCDKVVKKHCGKVVTTLSFLYGNVLCKFTYCSTFNPSFHIFHVPIDTQKEKTNNRIIIFMIDKTIFMSFAHHTAHSCFSNTTPILGSSCFLTLL